MLLSTTALLALTWAPSHPDEVTSLPGLSGALRSRIFSGYLKAAANGQTFYTHYVLTESRGSPADDPLVLWQQGGPGSSGFGFGWLAELGPYVLDADSLVKNVTGAPQLFEREYSWDANANLLLFEHPPGTGFSYCVDDADRPVVCTWNDQTQADAFYQTLLAFYASFPTYEQKELRLIGESYAGLLLPFLTAEIYRHPNDTPAKQLKGLAVGNGCPGTSGSTPDKRGSCNGPFGSYDTQHVLELAAGHSALPRALWDKVRSACGFPCAAPSWSEACDGPFTSECQDLIQQADEAIGQFNIYNFYDNCGDGNQLSASPQVGTLLEHARRYGGRGVGRGGGGGASGDALPSTGGQEYPCGTGKAAAAWANTPAVREALHMKPQSFYGRAWPQNNMTYTTYTGASYDLYPGLLQHVDVLIYNGDVDACVPYNSNGDWVDALATQQGYEQTEAWRPWKVRDVPAGYVTSYQANAQHTFKFLTVKQSGHMVPQYQPERAFSFYSRWLEGKPF